MSGPRLTAAALVSALIALSAAPSRAGLPPDAQAAAKDGLIAAQQQQWDLAIEKFSEARKSAPAAPELFGYLGLAESKIPGRELRAISWFGAYLAAKPDADNAASVRTSIDGLRIRSEADTARLIKTLQDAATQLPAGRQEDAMWGVAWLWAYSGNTDAAHTAVTLVAMSAPRMQAVFEAAAAERALVMARCGDFAGAQAAIASVSDTDRKAKAEINLADGAEDFARTQAESGDIAGAQKTLAFIQQAASAAPADLDYAPHFLNLARSVIVTAQLRAGEIADAQATAAPMTDDTMFWVKANAEHDIAEAQLAARDLTGAQASADVIANPQLKAFVEDDLAKARAASGDFAGAAATLRLVDQLAEADPSFKDVVLKAAIEARLDIAKVEAKAGDIAGAEATILLARNTADLPQYAAQSQYDVVDAERAVVDAQVKAKDFAGARRTIAAMQQGAPLARAGWLRDTSYRDVVAALAEVGDIADALATAREITNGSIYKMEAATHILEAQAKAGDAAAAQAAIAEFFSAATDKDRLSIVNYQAVRGDVAGARVIAEQMQAIGLKAVAYAYIAGAQADTGEVSGARESIATAQRLAGSDDSGGAHIKSIVVGVQLALGDLAGAQATAETITDARDKDFAEEAISNAQAKAGDFAGARMTADRIGYSNWKDQAEMVIGAHRAASGSGPMPTKLTPLVPASDWVIEIGRLNAPIFLDRAAFLRTLPADSGESAFKALHDGVKTLLDAQGDVERLLTLQDADQRRKRLAP